MTKDRTSKAKDQRQSTSIWTVTSSLEWSNAPLVCDLPDDVIGLRNGRLTDLENRVKTELLSTGSLRWEEASNTETPRRRAAWVADDLRRFPVAEILGVQVGSGEGYAHLPMSPLSVPLASAIFVKAQTSHETSNWHIKHRKTRD